MTTDLEHAEAREDERAETIEAEFLAWWMERTGHSRSLAPRGLLKICSILDARIGAIEAERIGAVILADSIHAANAVRLAKLERDILLATLT